MCQKIVSEILLFKFNKRSFIQETNSKDSLDELEFVFLIIIISIIEAT